MASWSRASFQRNASQSKVRAMSRRSGCTAKPFGPSCGSTISTVMTPAVPARLPCKARAAKQPAGTATAGARRVGVHAAATACRPVAEMAATRRRLSTSVRRWRVRPTTRCAGSKLRSTATPTPQKRNARAPRLQPAGPAWHPTHSRSSIVRARARCSDAPAYDRRGNQWCTVSCARTTGGRHSPYARSGERRREPRAALPAARAEWCQGQRRDHRPFGIAQARPIRQALAPKPSAGRPAHQGSRVRVRPVTPAANRKPSCSVHHETALGGRAPFATRPARAATFPARPSAAGKRG